MTKEQAKTIACEYINKSSAVLVAADGNVFFAEHKHFASHHAKEKNVELFEFSNEELLEAKPKKSESKAEDKSSKKAK